MALFDHSRYVLNKRLFKLVGLWPYQDKTERCLIFLFLAVGSVTMAMAQTRKLVVDHDDATVIFEAIPVVMYHMSVWIKVIASLLNDGKTGQLLQRMVDDWKEPMGLEVKVLEKFADSARMHTILYGVITYSSMTIFTIVPVAPKIIVAFGWANLSTEAQFCIPIDYYVDTDRYYAYMQIHLITAATVAATVHLSVDTMFVVFIQHAAGLFSKLGYRLEHLIDSEDLNIAINPPSSSDEPYWTVVDCIKKHKAAIEFADSLDDMYSTAFLFLMAMNIPAMSVTGLQVLWGKDKRMGVAETFRQMIFFCVQLVHIYFQFAFSQKLTDHSLYILEASYKAKWYKTSMRTRKLLSFMMMRSMIPAELKVGKLYTLSMENFSAAIRASMSYFTILCSMQ